jgi:ribosomal protein L40E
MNERKWFKLKNEDVDGVYVSTASSKVANVKYCPKCGANMSKEATYCPKCGEKQS